MSSEEHRESATASTNSSDGPGQRGNHTTEQSEKHVTRPPKKKQAFLGHVKKIWHSYKLRQFFVDPKTWFEVAALIVVVFYTVYAREQAQRMLVANQLSRDSLMLGQRAYLAVGIAEQIAPGIKIPITNIGHVPAKIITGSFTYLRVTYPRMDIIDKRSKLLETDKLVIAPGDTSTFSVFLAIPELSPVDQGAVDAGKQFLAINGTMTFDTGFNSTDTVLVNFSFDQSTKRWTRTSEGRSINFRQVQSEK